MISRSDSINILLLGMVYSTEVRPVVGQQYRDRVRIQKLELFGYNVYTLDDRHKSSSNTEPGKHCCSDFNKLRFLRQALLETWGTNVKFDYIILDYFFCPEGWLQTHWRKAFFDEVLPFFLKERFLKLDGEIWLPNKRGVSDSIKEYGENINKMYRIETVDNLNRNPLYAATDLAEEDLRLSKDNRTNQTEMQPLYEFSKFPFLMLRKRQEVHIPLFIHLWRNSKRKFDEDEDDEDEDDEDEDDEDEDEDDADDDDGEEVKCDKEVDGIDYDISSTRLISTVSLRIFWKVFGTTSDAKVWNLIKEFLYTKEQLKIDPYSSKHLEKFRWVYFYEELNKSFK